MTQKLAHAWDVVTGKVVFGTTPGVSRVFLRCYECRRIVPNWRVLKMTMDGPSGCKCGSQMVKPSKSGYLEGRYWLFVRGVVLRKWIARKTNWDPRIPWRAM